MTTNRKVYKLKSDYKRVLKMKKTNKILFSILFVVILAAFVIATDISVRLDEPRIYEGGINVNRDGKRGNRR